MRGRRFAALVIFVVQMMFWCTACQSAEDAVNASKDAVSVSGEVSGSADAQIPSTGEMIFPSNEASESTEESVAQERYETIPVEMLELRFVGTVPEEILWLEPQIITSQSELAAFRKELTDLWAGDEAKKRIEQFGEMTDGYSRERFEERALIGLYVRQYNWDYEYEVELVRDNELSQLNFMVKAQRPEEEAYPQDCAWLLLMEVDSAAVKDIAKMAVTLEKSVGGSRKAIWSDVVTMPGRLTERGPVVIENAEALQNLGVAAEVDDSLDWKVLIRNYMEGPLRQEKDAIIAFTIGSGYTGYEYDVGVIFDEASGELCVKVFRFVGKTLFNAGSSRIFLVEVKKADLEKATDITFDMIDVPYSEEALAEWNLPFGVEDRLISTHKADLDHDGQDEEIFLYYTVEAYVNRMSGTLTVGVVRDGEIIWSESRVMAPNPNGTVNAYFLYEKDGRDYLLYYSKEKNDYREYSSNFKCFYLDESGKYIQHDAGSLWLTWNKYRESRFPISADKLQAFADDINCLLTDSACLYSEFSEKIYVGWDIKQKNGADYYEDMSLLFSDGADYSGCQTIAEKTAVFNQARMNEWFEDGQIPEKPEEFKALMKDLIAEKRTAMSMFTQLRDEDRSVWFIDYNGEKLQIIEPEYKSTSPASYPGKVYYRADGGETPEQVAKIMVEAMVHRMMEDSQGQEFVITKYRITDQNLTSWEDIVASYTSYCWEEYLALYRGLEDTLLDYARKWVEESFAYGKWEVPLGEDMWYFYPSGYYHFDGRYLGSFEEYVQMETVVDGMVSFYYQGGSPQFLLVKYGDVYCMQKGLHWGE